MQVLVQSCSVWLRCVVFVSGFKLEGHTVDAEALTCWVWPIIEHMSEVSVTLQNTNPQI